MDIDKLEAGPELDALVAEKVMGWRMIRNDPLLSHTGWIDGDGRKRTRYDPPPYSTDIAAAWEVLEKFPWFRIDNRGDYEGNQAFMVELSDDAKNLSGKMWAPTAPLAICRAALRAVGA